MRASPPADLEIYLYRHGESTYAVRMQTFGDKPGTPLMVSRMEGCGGGAGVVSARSGGSEGGTGAG